MEYGGIENTYQNMDILRTLLPIWIRELFFKSHAEHSNPAGIITEYNSTGAINIFWK